MSTENKQRHLDDTMIKALLSGNYSLVESSLESGANPNATGVSGVNERAKTALELAFLLPAEDRAKLVGALMAHGANPNSNEIPGINLDPRVSAFMSACKRHDEISAGAMLDSSGPVKVDLLERDHNGCTPSMVAINLSPAFLNKMQLFFERESMPFCPELGRDHLWSCVDNEGRNSSMLCWGGLPSLQWLYSQEYIDFPCLINTRATSSGKTVLWDAADSDTKDSVDYLLGHGAKANIVNNKGESLVSHLESLCSDCSLKINRHLLPLRSGIKDSVKAVASAQMAMASIEEMLDKAPDRGQKVAP